MAIVAVAAAGLATTACSGGPTALELDPRKPEGIAAFRRLLDVHRASIGCPALDWHVELAGVAESHSADMASRDFFGHVNPEGESPFDRMRRAGLAWSGPAGENIAASDQDPAVVFDGFLASPTHRQNIERCEYTHHGLGLVEGRWTHLFLANPAGR